MTPEQDPVVCQLLESAINDIAGRTRPRTFPDPHDLTSEPGSVPPRIVARLSGIAKRYGFTVSRSGELRRYSQMVGGLMLGCTAGAAHPTHPNTVRIMRGLSSVSEVRVLAHETAHVVLGHAGLSYWDSERIQNKRWAQACMSGDPEDGGEEAAAELASAAFCQVAGIGYHGTAAAFIQQKLGSQPVTQETRQAALLAARLLWKAAAPVLAVA